MKKILAMVLCLAMLVSAVTMLSSCGGDSDLGAEVDMYYVGRVYDFDPTRAYVDDDAVKLFHLLYEPLFYLDADGGVSNALAKSYKIVEDAEKGEYSMEIELRETYWNDGAQVMATDVLYAWQRILSCDFQSQAAPLLYDIKNAILVKQGELSIDDLGISADKTRLTITFEQKPNYDLFLRNLTSIALVPLREYTAAKAEDYWGKRKATIVTNGPFAVGTLDFNTGELTLQRNPYYHRSPEDTKGVKKQVTPYLLQTLWLMGWSYDLTDDYGNFLHGELDNINYEDYEYLDTIYTKFTQKSLFYIGDLSLAKRAELKDQATVSDLLSTTVCILNGRSRIMQYEDARLALAAAVDREALANAVVFAKPATGFISHGVYEGESAKKFFRNENSVLLSTKADMTTASQYMQAYIRAYNAEPDHANNQIALGSLGSAGRIRVAYKESEADQRLAELLKAAWEQIGFSVTLVPLSATDVEMLTDPNDPSTEITIKTNDLQLAYEEMSTADSVVYDVLIMDYQMHSTNALAPLYGFTSDKNGNGIDMTLDAEGYRSYEYYRHASGYANEAYDALIAQAAAMNDLDERAAVLHEAEQMLLEDAAVIPLLFNQSFFLASKDLKGIKVNAYGIPNMTKMSQKNYKNYITTQD